jgi:hypothetical protein
MALVLGVSAPLSSTVSAPNGIRLTVYPDGSVGVAIDLSQSARAQPGTEPTVTLRERATSAGGQTTFTASETESLPSDTLNQAPYNYSASMTSSGSYSNGISKGSITVQAVPGVSFPGATLEASYRGDNDSLSASGNATLQYGTYGSGQSAVVVNATTIGQDLQLLQSEGLNFSGIQRLLANASTIFPQGDFSLTSFGLNAVYGSSSATVYGDISLTGNMTALPFMMATLYLGLTGLTTSTTATSSLSATAVCNPQVHACAITLESVSTASTAVTSCSMENLAGNSTVGTLLPSDQTVPATGSATVICTLPADTPIGAAGSLVNGTLDLTNGATIGFLGTWNSSAQLPTPTTSTTTMVSTSTSTRTTTTSLYSQPMLDLFSAYSKVISSLQEYTYTMSYASGIIEVSETGVAAKNFDLDQAMPLLALYTAGQNATSSVVQFLNTTRVDVSSFSANMSEAQNASGEYVTNASIAGLTIYPQIVKSSEVFNESGLFNLFQSMPMNVTVTGGTNNEGSVSITVPASVPAPASASEGSKSWTDVNMSSLAGLEFSTGQAITTSTTSSAGVSKSFSATTSTSSNTSSTGSIPEFPYQLLLVTAFTVLVVISYLIASRRLLPAHTK